MGTYFHVDIDAFFAAAEVIDDPSLLGRPVIVGATPGTRGVVSTCSYEARAFGVRSAMPISEAVRLCPGAAFRTPRIERYAELSRAVMGILDGFTPDVLRVSIDEASLDMTGTGLLSGSPDQAAVTMKARVRDGTGLTISVGVASNRYVAKIASGCRKPDGLVVVPEGGEADFMLGLPLKDLWGAGGKTRARFAELGIGTMAQLRALSAGTLVSLFGRAGGEYLYRACRGVDPGTYAGEARSHSVSSETTFERDVRDRETVEAVLMAMSEELAGRMYEEGASSRTVVVKLRYDDFETVSARETRPSPFSSSGGIYAAAMDLFARKWDGRPLRLVGLGLAGLGKDGDGQGSLFPEPGERASRVERAVFEATRRGLGRITKARLVKPPPGGKGPTRPGTS